MVECWCLGFGLLELWLRFLVVCCMDGIFGGSFLLCFFFIISCFRRLLVDNLLFCIFCMWLKFKNWLFLWDWIWLRFLVGLYSIFFIGLNGLWEVGGWNNDCVLNLLFVNLMYFRELLGMSCWLEEGDLLDLFGGLILLEEFLLSRFDDFGFMSLWVLGLMLMLCSFFLM